MDIYEALLSGTPTEQDKIQALASKLRGKQGFGQLGVLTGDEVLGKMGENFLTQSGEEAKTLGGYSARRRELEAQEAMRAASALERAKEAELGRAHDVSMEQMRQRFEAGQRAQERALRKALKELDGEEDYRNIPSKQLESMINEAQETQDIGDVISNFKDEYATAGLPGSREAANYAVSKGLPVTENAKDAAAWWADYERLYTLPTRNRLFGSALTAPERAAWEKNAISPSMKPDVIRERIKNLNDLKQNALKRKRDTFIKAGYDPDEVGAIFDNPRDVGTEDEVIDLPPR